MQSSALAQGQSLSHLLPGQQKYTQSVNLFSFSIRACFKAREACFVFVYLIVSQCVESFPVVVNLSCDILILQNDSGHPTLTPFFKQRKN